MSLINWNPDKGDPNDYHPVMTDVLIPREEIKASRTVVELRRSSRAEVEKQLIEDAESEDYESIEDAESEDYESEDEDWEEDSEDEETEYDGEDEYNGEGKQSRNLVGRWRCFYPVNLVATLNFEQADGLLDLQPWEKDGEPVYRWAYLEPRTLTVRITYPLQTALQVTVPPYKRIVQWPGQPSRERVGMTPGYLLWVIAQEYKHIYEAYEQYGVWGHTLSDLCFEGFEINEKGEVSLLIGS